MFPSNLPRRCKRVFAVCLTAAFATTLFSVCASWAADSPSPSLAELLASYQRAMNDPGAPRYERFEEIGTLSGQGLTGSFHTWIAGERERDDENLGARSERRLRIGERVWYANADGDVRELTGILLRRSRTQRLIDSGDFARQPEHCVALGRRSLDGKAAYAIDVAATGGETETLYLDAATYRPLRVAYDDDDGEATIDLSDWRSVGGHHFPFKVVQSDGDREFDTTENAQKILLDQPSEAAVFAPLKARTIEMPGAQTLALQAHDGHLYAPVRIRGKSYSFLVDTGAQNILLDTRVVRELGLSSEGALEASGASRVGGLQVATLDELDIGSGKLRDLVVTTLDLSAATSGAFHIDGILGYPFFGAATVRLDPAAQSMTFGPPGSILPRGERIPIDTDRAAPEASFRIGESLAAPFIVDTGNAGELLLYHPFVDKHPGVVPVTDHGRRNYGIGGSTASYKTSLDRIDIGSTSLYHIDTDVMLATRGAFADRFDAGNVGLGLLKNFVITFDESDGAMYLEKSTAFDDGRSRPQ